MTKIIGIGEVVWDCLPDGRKLGGAPVNFCFFAREMGAEAYPLTAVGCDLLGNETLDALALTSLDLSLIQRNDLPTSRVIVELDAQGIPQYNILENVAWDNLVASPQALNLVAEADAVCWGSLAQRSSCSAATVLQLVDAAPINAIKVFDINIRQHYYSYEVIDASLCRANVLKLNEDELPLLIDMFGLCMDDAVADKEDGEAETFDVSLDEANARAISLLIERYDLKYVIFTQGAVCSGIFDASGEISHLETPSVDVADTVGAGDSFTATFITSLLRGKSVVEAHRRAVDIAAFVCTQHGAINPLPKENRL